MHLSFDQEVNKISHFDSYVNKLNIVIILPLLLGEQILFSSILKIIQYLTPKRSVAVSPSLVQVLMGPRFLRII